MDGFLSLLSIGFPAAVSVAAVVLLLIHLKDGFRRPVTVFAPAPTGGGWRPIAGPGMPPVYWHARITGHDNGWNPRFGTLCLAEGQAWFVPDHHIPGDAWRPELIGPVAGSHVVRRSALSVHRGDVDWWINGHELRMVVGRCRINRWVDNDFKDLASRADAHTVVSMLMANGARPGPPPHRRELR